MEEQLSVLQGWSPWGLFKSNGMEFPKKLFLMMGNMVIYGVSEADLVGPNPLVEGSAVYAVKPWPKEYWRSPEEAKPQMIDLTEDYIQNHTWLTEEAAIEHFHNQFKVV